MSWRARCYQCEHRFGAVCGDNGKIRDPQPENPDKCEFFEPYDKRTPKEKTADFIDFVVSDSKEPSSNFPIPVGAHDLWELGEEIRRLRQ